MQNPYETLPQAIADPGNIGLDDEVIQKIGEAFVKALAYRTHYRKSVIGKIRGTK